MKISVIIATYNRGALLSDLLRDLSAQKDAGTFEVCIVDDGSAVPASRFVEPREAPFPLRLIRQENAGPARARDHGIEVTDGEIVVIIDDDMTLPPHFLAAHRALHERGFDVVLGLIRASGELSDMPLFERFHADQLEKFVKQVRAGSELSGSALCTGNVSFRRSYYEGVGGFDATLARSEDRDLGIRLQKAGARFAFSEDAFTTHRSDHNDLEKWKKRAFLYGVYDFRIAEKHHGDVTNHPWYYMRLVNPISRPLLVCAICSSRFGKRLSKAAMRVSDVIDRLGFERAAIKGTTLVFGIEYFMGVRSEYASSLAATSELMRILLSRGTTAPAASA